MKPSRLLFTLAGVSVAAACLIFLAVGCASRTSAPQKYGDAYKALMVSYRSRMQELAARPLPPASLPWGQKRVVLARQVDDVADAYAEYEKRLDTLQAPPALGEVQSTTDDFFKVSTVDSRQWAEAIRHGDRKTQTRVEHQGEVDQLAAMTRIQLALKRIGETSPKLQDFIHAQQKALNN